MSVAESDPSLQTGIHPRLVAELGQQRLDACWSEIQNDIGRWNQRLQQAEAVNDNDINELVSAAVRELDGKWPFVGDHFLVSGRWVEPVRDEAKPGLVIEYRSRDDVLEVAPSFGFCHVPDSEPVRIGMAFVVGSVVLRSAALFGNLQLAAMADPSEISLTYVRPAKLNNEQIITRIGATLAYYDALLNLYLQSDNSDFYEASWGKQRRFFDTILREVNDIMVMPDVPVHVEATAERLYARKEELQRYEPTESSDQFVVSGTLQSVTILEASRLDRAPLRSKAELIDADAGLCMVLQLDPEYVEAYKADYLFVPTRKIDKLELHQS